MNQREMIAQIVKETRPKFNEVFFTRDEDEIITE